MSFLEHLDELRSRLIRILLALIVGVAIAFPFRNQLFNLLFLPQNIRVQNLLADGLNSLERFGLQSQTLGLFELWLRANASMETPFTPNFRSPMEPFTALFKICIGAGLLLAMPVILYQIWMFVVPAMTTKEKRAAVPLMVILWVFFVAGTLFAFFIAAPLLLEMSANLWRTSEVVLQPQNLWTFDEYLGFLMQLVLAFGIAFELPLVMAFLARMDIMNAAAFREKRRYAVVLLVVVSAVLTPGDIVPMMTMAAPLILLYELGILFAAIAGRRRALASTNLVNADELESSDDGSDN